MPTVARFTGQVDGHELLPGPFGKIHAGRRVILLVADRNIRIISEDGELLRALTLDPTRDYQPRGVKPGPQPRQT